MSLIDSLTPKNTEEIKPGLFIKKTGRGYRQVNPMAWMGKYRWQEQKKSIFCFRTLFTIALIIFITWGYYSDTKGCVEFQENPCEYLVEINKFCLKPESLGGFEDFEVINDKQEDTFTV